ncbi:hypothetical protein IW261DRAFT_276379 [Armillaria novae-zelandiae]|uniref:F-box domain-containing protein n=1 Tax=Armillaria novae-zelandiae TaxID=153914 RepID=A0AA39N872_9AGAR|nr:hypothetical protein IW261DRAFT_276379 [Armillaria novae-zelandiae]
MALQKPLKLASTAEIRQMELSSLLSQETGSNSSNMDIVTFTAATTDTADPQFIHDLPVELLYEIFLWAVQENPASGDESILTPWALSHVCRQWRLVAISFPCLWSTIHVALTRETPRHGFSIKDSQGLGTALRRSGTTALSLRADFPDVELSAGHLRAHDLLIVMASASPRWKDIRMSAPLSVFDALFERVGSGSLPLLQSINFEMTAGSYWGAIPATSRLTDVFLTSPILHSVTIFPFLAICLPSSVKELTTKDLTQNELSSVIDDLPHLEILNVVGLRAWHAIGWAPPPHVHTTLSQIEIESAQDLSHFTLPALTHLKILKPFSSSPQNPDWRTNFSLDVLKRFILRSACSIGYLHLRIHEAGPDVTGILSLLVDTTILRVDVTNHHAYGDLLKALRSREALLLPKLDTLEFFGVRMSEQHFEKVFGLVQYRWNHPALRRIKKVYVENGPFVDGNCHGGLDETIRSLAIHNAQRELTALTPLNTPITLSSRRKRRRSKDGNDNLIDIIDGIRIDAPSVESPRQACPDVVAI